MSHQKPVKPTPRQCDALQPTHPKQLSGMQPRPLFGRFFKIEADDARTKLERLKRAHD